jgi:hypothetical protein
MKKHWSVRLKQENAILKQKLFTLVNEPESLEAKEIIETLRFEFEQERALWFGDREDIQKEALSARVNIWDKDNNR